MKGKNLSGELGGGGNTPGGPETPNHLSQDEIKDLENIKCDKCGCEVFVTGLELKLVPSVHPKSPPGDSAIQPVKSLACANCGAKKSIQEQQEE